MASKTGQADLMPTSQSFKWIPALHSHGSSLLSLTPLDLQAPNFHIQLALSFRTAPDDAEQLLEESLSKVLNHYPEFAGRLGADKNGKKCIHINNAGAALVAARRKEDMGAYLDEHGNDIDALLPSSDRSLVDIYPSIPLLIQLTRFSCGGLMVGFEVHHQVVDVTSFAQFLTHWSALARTGTLPLRTSHTRSAFFPRDPPKPEFDHPEYTAVDAKVIPKESLTTICVHFSAEQLLRLKATAGARYSTFMCLSAFLWKTMTKLHNLSPEAKSVLVFPVDGRKALAAGPEFLGNGIFGGIVVSTAREVQELPLQGLAEMVYKSLKTTVAVEHLHSSIDFLATKEQNEFSSRYVSIEPHIEVSSCLHFPLYDVNFGFGDPASLATSGAIGMVVLAPTSKKDGSVDVFWSENIKRIEALKKLLVL